MWNRFKSGYPDIENSLFEFEFFDKNLLLLIKYIIVKMTKEEIQNIYDYSKSKSEICKKLNIRTNQNGFNIDKDILEYFSQIGISSREQISKKNLSNHWLEIQKRDYELNPKYCEYCGKKLPFEKRFAKCCNQSCGSALGNKKKGKRTEETKIKISKSVKETFKNHPELVKNQYSGPNKEYYISKIKSLNTKQKEEYSNPNNYKYISELILLGYVLNNDNYEYKDKLVNYNNFKKHNCVVCGKEFYCRIIKSGKLGGGDTCCEKCHKELVKSIGKETYKKVKNEGRFQGWKSRNITSYAEKFWKNVLDNNNIEYIKEYSLKRENSQSYFLDFYIEINNRKIDLEIDGKQHLYVDRKEADKIRDEYVKSKGIEVYRISWNEIKTENGKQIMKEKIDKFLKFIR